MGHKAALRKGTMRWISLMTMMSEGSFWKNGVMVILSAMPMIGWGTGLGRRIPRGRLCIDITRKTSLLRKKVIPVKKNLHRADKVV